MKVFSIAARQGLKPSDGVNGTLYNPRTKSAESSDSLRFLAGGRVVVVAKFWIGAKGRGRESEEVYGCTDTTAAGRSWFGLTM